MAYSTAGDAAVRITGLAHGSSAMLGKIGIQFEKVVSREVIQTDAVNTPEQRPESEVDARITAMILGWDSSIPSTRSAASVVITFSEANGDTGATVTYPTMLASGYRSGINRRAGGNPMALDFELQASSFSETFSM